MNSTFPLLSFFLFFLLLACGFGGSDPCIMSGDCAALWWFWKAGGLRSSHASSFRRQCGSVRLSELIRDGALIAF